MSVEEQLGLHPCALCENQSNLSAPCCCQKDENAMFKVTELRLLKRCNLQHGDRLCSSHYDKLRSGMIFGGGGGGSGCCAPFHVGNQSGTRLRPVPRTWRQLFDNSVITKRYRPSLQICNQCYNITLDLMLNAEENGEHYPSELNDSGSTSSQSKYTSPRKWLSSTNLNLPGSSTSGSTFSLSSARSSSNLLSLYAAQREKLGHPRAVPDSVKRYFRYKNFDNLSSEKSRNTSRSDSFDFSEDNSGSVVDDDACTNLSDDRSITPQLIKRSSSSLLLQCSPKITEDKDNNRHCFKLENANKDIHVSSTELVLSSGASSRKSSPALKRKVRRLSLSSSSNVDEQESMISSSGMTEEDCVAGVQSEVEHSLKVESEEGNNNLTSQSKIKCEIQEPENQEKALSGNQDPKHRLQITVKSVVSPTHLRSDNQNNEENNVSDGDCTDIPNSPVSESPSDLQLTSTKQANKPQLDIISRTLAHEVVAFVLNNFKQTGMSKAGDNAELSALVKKINLSHLNVFASTLSHSILQFALQDCLYQLSDNNRSRNSKCNSIDREDEQQQDDGLFLPSRILHDINASLNELKTCDHCSLNIYQVCADIVLFAQAQAGKIMSNSLKGILDGNYDKEKYLNQLVKNVSKTCDAVLDANKDFMTQNQNDCGHFIPTVVTWNEKEKRYRSEISLNVSKRHYGDGVKTELNRQNQPNLVDSAKRENLDPSSSKKVNSSASSNKQIFNNNQVIECVVDEIIPITRSFSTGFIDKYDDDVIPKTYSKIFRSSSCDSFFTLTCQITQNQNNSNDEFIVKPIHYSNEFLNTKDEKEPAVLEFEDTSDSNSTLSSRLSDFEFFENETESLSMFKTSNFSDKERTQIISFNDTPCDEDNRSLSPPQHMLSESFSSEDTCELLKGMQTESIITETVKPSVVRFDLGDTKEADLSVEDYDEAVENDDTSLASENSESKNTQGFEENTVAQDVEQALSLDSNKDTEIKDSFLDVSADDFDEQGSKVDIKAKEEDEHSTNKAPDENDEEKMNNNNNNNNNNNQRREQVDWFPTDETLQRQRGWQHTNLALKAFQSKQRRSTQFLRALSEATMLRNRVKMGKGGNQLLKPEEEIEDENVPDIFYKAIEDSTPQFLRRKTEIDESNEPPKDPTRIVARAIVVVSLVGVLVFIGWRFYSSS